MRAIHGIRGKLCIILQIIKETGARIEEVLNLRWLDIDTERNAITINQPEKHGNARVFRFSTQLIQRIQRIPQKNEYIFGKSRTSSGSHFSNAGRRIAGEYNNPRLLRIHFRTIRHWKATMEYHRTKDILHVKEMSGHIAKDNTLIHVHLEKISLTTRTTKISM